MPVTVRYIVMTTKREDQFIGVFDSGVGGLTVLHHSMELLPYEHFLYYADSANVPYGSKNSDEIIDLVDAAVMNMTKYPLKAILLACNTATSAAISFLRNKYNFPIIGMEPAVKPAIVEGDPRKILVLATELTLKERKYKELVHTLDVSDKVDALPLQQLVDFAEEFDFDSPALQRYLRSELGKVKWEEYHSVVIGCTHFHYFNAMFTRFIPPQIHFVDGRQGTIKHLSNSIEHNTFGTPSKLKCMLSGLDVSNEVLHPYLNYLKKQRSALQSSIN